MHMQYNIIQQSTSVRASRIRMPLRCSSLVSQGNDLETTKSVTKIGIKIFGVDALGLQKKYTPHSSSLTIFEKSQWLAILWFYRIEGTYQVTQLWQGPSGVPASGSPLVAAE